MYGALTHSLVRVFGLSYVLFPRYRAKGLRRAAAEKQERLQLETSDCPIRNPLPLPDVAYLIHFCPCVWFFILPFNGQQVKCSRVA